MMKGWGRRVGIFIPIAVVLASCDREPRCASDWCGAIVVTSGAEADVLFPPASIVDIGISLNDLIFDRLADIGPEQNVIGDGGFTPRLAKRWVFENDTTIAFTIDEDARWHDGMPVTSADVAFSFDVYRDPAVAAAAQTRLGEIFSVETRDARTAVMRFRRWYPELFYDAVHHVWILPKHLLDTVPRHRLRTHAFGRAPVGSGPFHFVRWQASEFIELAGEVAYHGGRPGVPRILWRFASGPAAAVTMLLAGEADVLMPIPTPEDRARIEASGQFALHAFAANVYTYVLFNSRGREARDHPHPLFADRRLRRAIALGVDNNAITAALFGENGIAAIGPLTPHYASIVEGVSPIPHSADAANRELSALGWVDADGDGTREKDGRRLAFELLVPNSSAGRLRAAEIIQHQLKDAGVEVTIADMEMTTWESRARTGNFDAVFAAAQHDPPPSSPLTDAWSTAAFAAMNYGRYSNRRVDEIVGLARLERDASRATALWREAYQLIIDDSPAIWIYVPKTDVAIHHRIVEVTLRPDLWTATMWRWRIDPAGFITRDLVGVP